MNTCMNIYTLRGKEIRDDDVICCSVIEREI